MPYRCKVCTKTLDAGSVACAACGTRFSQPVPEGEALPGPFPSWPPQTQGKAKPTVVSGGNVLLGVLVALAVIVGLIWVTVNSKSGEPVQAAQTPAETQKRAAYTKATENLGRLFVRQDPRVSHVTASYSDPHDALTTDTLTVTVRGDLTPYTTRTMAQYYYRMFSGIRNDYFDQAAAAKCFVYVNDDTGKEVAHADSLGVDN